MPEVVLPLPCGMSRAVKGEGEGGGGGGEGGEERRGRRGRRGRKVIRRGREEGKGVEDGIREEERERE
eukprot:223650-Hanusia_phi.AAC.1